MWKPQTPREATVVALLVDLEEATAAVPPVDSTAAAWARRTLAMRTSDKVTAADLAAAFAAMTSNVDGFIISTTVWDSTSFPALRITTTSRMSHMSMIHTAMRTRRPTILAIATRAPELVWMATAMEALRKLRATM